MVKTELKNGVKKGTKADGKNRKLKAKTKPTKNNPKARKSKVQKKYQGNNI